MMAACNSLRFRPSLPACNACLAANKANMTASGCDDPKNHDDVASFCGTLPIAPPRPTKPAWDPRYQTNIMKSTDNGETWTAPQLINVTNTWHSSYTGRAQSRGFELEHSEKYRGRLVQAHNYNSIPNDYSWHLLTRDYVLYSDDHGVTWVAGQLTPQGWGECSLAELRNGSLLLSSRLSDGYLEMEPMLMRGFARSDDGGQTWAEWWYLEDRQPTLFTTTCHQGLTSDPDTGVVYWGHPGAANSTRTNYTVHSSSDGGATLDYFDRVWAGGAGYSELAIIPQPGGSRRSQLSSRRHCGSQI